MFRKSYPTMQSLDQTTKDFTSDTLPYNQDTMRGTSPPIPDASISTYFTTYIIETEYLNYTHTHTHIHTIG